MDTRAGRHDLALAKLIWFFRNALKYQPSLYGVRLSYALSDWKRLASKYPPARVALKREREAARMRLRGGKGGHRDFHDFAALNRQLGLQRSTTELFAWLDRNRPRVAKRSYQVAERSLIRSKRYRLCGKYIDTKRSVEMLRRFYRMHLRMAKKPRLYGDDMREYAEDSYSHGATTLVALLVRNHRVLEADEAVRALSAENPSARLRRKLRGARRGVVPPPWPP